MPYKRIFISGGAGVIGTALVEKLLLSQSEIYVGDLKPCPNSWKGRLCYRMGDLNTIDPLELLEFNPNLVIHLAATFERSVESPSFFEENYHHNIALSHTLLSILKECKELKKVVLASSYLTYDPANYLFSNPQHEAVDLLETDSVRPRNLCGAAKLFNEEELQFFHTLLHSDCDIVCARIFRVYGKNSRDIISRWIQSALKKIPLTVYQPENLFDYIYAEDVAEGLLKLADSSYLGIVNLGSGKARKIQEVISILKNHFPDLQTISSHEAHSELYEASQANMERFHSVTSWLPHHTLENAIPKLIEFEKNRLKEYSQEFPIKHILVSSISKKIPLLSAIKTASKKINPNTLVYGCDTDDTCIGSYFVDTFWKCKKLSEIQKEDILDYCNANQIHCIIPTRDGELQFFAKHRSWFYENGITVLVSEPDVITTCLDKKAFADWLIKKGYPAIPTSLNLSQTNFSSYVVKEQFGAGSISLGLNLSKEQANSHAAKLKSPIFQPFINGEEFSVDCYRTLSGKVKGVVVRKRNLIVNGESQVTTTVIHPKMEKLAVTLANDLNLYGHAVFQIIETTDKELFVIECNPRFGGASTASIAVGLDSFYWFLLESHGEPLQMYPFRRLKTNLRQVRYPMDRISGVG